jgi:hypothetical protein
MTTVEVCCGIAPASRDSAFLGISSVSFDSRKNQIETAISELNNFFTTFEEKSVCFTISIYNNFNLNL